MAQTDYIVAAPQPRKAIGDVFVRVLTYNGNADDAETDFTVNWSDAERRDWLISKHMFWAFCNGRTVEIFNINDQH